MDKTSESHHITLDDEIPRWKGFTKTDRVSSKRQSPNRVTGWILDVYPSIESEVTVWIISKAGKRLRFTDKFQPKIYVSGKQEDIERLSKRLYNSKEITTWNFTYKYAQPTDIEKSRVLEITLKDFRKMRKFTRYILRLGNYLRYAVHNCDLHVDQAYLFSHNLFPLALVEVKNKKTGLEYKLLDSVESIDYKIPKIRTIKIHVDIDKKGKIANFRDSIKKIFVIKAHKEININSDTEEDTLLQLVETVQKIDPDIIITTGGDSYLLPYLIERANINNVLDEFILSRDNTPFNPTKPSGKTFFSYGRTFYRASTIRLYGRIHIDENNTFILKKAGFDGLIEIARTCRVPLHTAARSSIGSSMSSLQFYQAIKSDVLIPRNKSIPEAFKSAYKLLVGDRGGFVFGPQVGAHDFVGEVDFSSMYPSLMINNNISAGTVLCKCCPDSPLRIPELDYPICTKRKGIVPKTLQIILSKRLLYKRLKTGEQDSQLREVYDKRQASLKWILVTCFGYLGYRNAKFGTVDGHMGVCAFGRDILLKAFSIAKSHGFEVIHGIVDSLWLKNPDATNQEYEALCETISTQVGVPINFEGRYKWIVFMPSKNHPQIGVLNRYYGVLENGKVKVRGLEVRRRDTPRFVSDAQTDMINSLSHAENSYELRHKIPEALDVVKEYRRRLLDGEIPVWDLIITKRLSKNLNKYKQQVSQLIAAKQLIREGLEVHTGNNIKFLFTHAGDKRYDRRVKSAQLIDEDVNPDLKKYLLLLYSSAANLLSFSGFTTKSIYDAIKGNSQESLLAY